MLNWNANKLTGNIPFFQTVKLQNNCNGTNKLNKSWPDGHLTAPYVRRTKARRLKYFRIQ